MFSYIEGGVQRLRVFENRILRRTFWLKRDEYEEKRSRLNEEFNSLYCLLNIAVVIKARRLRWSGMLPEWKKVGLLSKF